MNTEQARERLIAERQRLQEVRDAASHLSKAANSSSGADHAKVDQHPAEQANETIDRELEEGVLQRMEAELAEVAAALERIERATYGVCEVCAKPIAEARLEAKPAARYCIEDQAKAERDPLLRSG